MSTHVDKIVQAYRSFANIPFLLGSRLSTNGTAVTSVWSQRNLERGKNAKFVQTHVLSSELRKVADGCPFDVSGESLTSSSPSDAYRAVIREIEEKDSRKQHLEVWSSYNLIQATDIATLQDLHGDVYTDGDFGSLQWSPDETKLLYIAEKKEPKSDPFYKKKLPKPEEGKDSTELPKGEQYVFRQDWGEQLVNKKQSVIVLYNLLTDSFKILEGIPEGLCPAQIAWAPDGTYIVGVALRTQPRKFGLIYCTNRPGAIFTLDFNGNYDEISPAGKAVKSPVFSQDGKTLVWLQREADGPHHSCMSLVKRDVPLKEQIEPTVIVNTVSTVTEITGGRKFHGLYNVGFAKRCWASDRRLVVSTNQRCTINTYVVDIDSKTITELEYPDGSQIALDVHNDVILVNRRNFFVRDKLAIAKMPPKGKEGAITFEEISNSERTEYSKDYMYDYLDLKYGSTDDVDTFSAIYVGPKSGLEKTVPLVIWPHGGPHSAFANNLSLELSLFGAFGFAVLLINYRGSIGAGQDSVKFLLGKIGRSDVADCIFAGDCAISKYPWLDPDRVALIGGSHGGFLVAHLSGQYPDKFKVAVMRNPVIDVASMSTISDIPDWCYAECGSAYSQVGPPDDNILLTMRKASPIEHAHKVKAPTLLQVGSKDLRVPPLQALEYYHRLKANEVTVKMNMYDDNHPLGTIHNEIDNLINSLLWIEKYINTS